MYMHRRLTPELPTPHTDTHPRGSLTSSHSITVSGMVSSMMVVSTSTKGTPMMTPLNRSGRMLVTAPMSRPPAERPSMHSLGNLKFEFELI